VIAQELHADSIVGSVLAEYRSLDPLEVRIDTHLRYSETADDIEAAVDRAAALPPGGALLDVGGHAHVERHDGALVFDAPEPVIAYAVSCLTGFGVPAGHPLRPAVERTVAERGRALFTGTATRRDPKGYVVVTAHCPAGF
jgi:hypothetical protein